MWLLFSQLIYDFEVTEVDATVGFICSDIDRISKDLKDSLIEIGVKIPTDQRYRNKFTQLVATVLLWTV